MAFWTATKLTITRKTIDLEQHLDQRARIARLSRSAPPPFSGLPVYRLEALPLTTFADPSQFALEQGASPTGGGTLARRMTPEVDLTRCLSVAMMQSFRGYAR